MEIFVRSNCEMLTIIYTWTEMVEQKLHMCTTCNLLNLMTSEMLWFVMVE